MGLGSEYPVPLFLRYLRRGGGEGEGGFLVEHLFHGSHEVATELDVPPVYPKVHGVNKTTSAAPEEVAFIDRLYPLSGSGAVPLLR
jgi:hypothetical protein